MNDAPPLAQAAIGTAIGTGDDVAIGSAGATLVQGDLSAIVKARPLSHPALRDVRRNPFSCSTTTLPDLR